MRRKLAALAAVAVVVWLALQGTAGAHTEVLRADPQPGSEVTGTVDRVHLTFLDPVRPGTTIAVTDDAGTPVPGMGAVEEGADGRTAAVRFEPIVAAGGYLVEYEFTAEDGDVQLESYRFTLRPSPLGAGGSDDGGGLRTDTAGIAAAAVFCAALVASVATALLRR